MDMKLKSKIPLYSTDGGDPTCIMVHTTWQGQVSFYGFYAMFINKPLETKLKQKGGMFYTYNDSNEKLNVALQANTGALSYIEITKEG